jgi:hypothetical protein
MMFRIVFWVEAAHTSETSVDNYITRQYIPEDNSEHVYVLFYSIYTDFYHISHFFQRTTNNVLEKAKSFYRRFSFGQTLRTELTR